MRVVYLHQYFTTPDMAGGTRSYEMARRLALAGHQVDVVSAWRDAKPPAHSIEQVVPGVTVHWIGVPYSNHMSFRRRLGAFLHFAFVASWVATRINADVVVATSTPLTIAIPGILASRLRGRPLVFEVRDLWPDVPIALGALRNPIAIACAKLLEIAAYRSSSRVIALAPGMKSAIVEKGVPEARVEVIPNGCDFDIFAPSVRVDIGRDFDPASPPNRILYIGAMGIANGVEYIPRLAAAMRERNDRDVVRFHLYGDGGRRASVEALARELGVHGSSVVFHGSVPKRALAIALASADATVITYDGPEIVFRDSVSNKFFDSIAAGKPVIANYAGFATQIAQSAGAGWILPREVPQAAAELSALLCEPSLVKQAGIRALELARSRFDRNALGAKFIEVLEQAILDS